jgi:hypothetical protein
VRVGASRLLCLGLVGAVSLGALSLSTHAASAQTDEQRAAARTAATEGIRAFEAGRYQEALDYCKRAEAIMHAPTHLLLIARASTKLGRLVEAQEAYFRIQRDQLTPDAPAAFVEAQQKAAEEQAALAPRVPTLKVELDGAKAADVTVTLDGAALPAALIGLAGPIDPGEHTLVAKGAGAASDPVTVTVAEGAKAAVTLVVRPIAVAGGEVGTVASPPEEPSRSNGALRLGGWIGVGIGAAGLVAGTLFVLKNHSNRSDATALCNAGGCPESKRADVTSLDSSANSAATLAWVSYGIGAAGLATGAVLLWMSGTKPAASQTARVSPWIGARSAGMTVTF